MSNRYFWDLGFDFNAVQPQGSQVCYLQNGFVMMGVSINGKSSNVPATPVNLSPGDTLSFNAFNVTVDPVQGQYSILDGSIQFQSAVTNQVVKSPFSNDDGTDRTLIPFPPTAAPTGLGPSVICSGVQAVTAQAPGPATFPVYAGPASLPIANAGRFLMSVALNVQDPNGNQRTFRVDPEMVVESVG